MWIDDAIRRQKQAYADPGTAVTFTVVFDPLPVCGEPGSVAISGRTIDAR